MIYGVDMELREYQTLAIDEVRNLFKQGKKKILLVSPTGSQNNYGLFYDTKSIG